MTDLLAPRWRGQPGRLEVWYSTLTDPATATGLWLHHEVVAPTDGSDAYGHGWITVSEPGLPPVLERFDLPGPAYDGQLAGSAGDVSWDLVADTQGQRPMWTFPKWAWRSGVLPAAQVVAAPTATYTGTVRVGERELRLDGARGADARIYGHGNGKEWCWLHADLGDGDALELVAAVSVRRGLDRLPPLPLMVVRVDGHDRPRDTLLAAAGLRARLRSDGFTVTGLLGRDRIEIDVALPESATVDVDYRDPDGATLLCRNSTLADARIRVGDRRWQLDGRAHAEVGGFREISAADAT